jgi:hypothetical protein
LRGVFGPAPHGCVLTLSFRVVHMLRICCTSWFQHLNHSDWWCAAQVGFPNSLQWLYQCLS